MRPVSLFGKLTHLALLFLVLTNIALAQGGKMRSPDKDEDKDRPDRPLTRQRWFRKGRTIPDGRPAAEFLFRANMQKMEQRTARETILQNAREAIQGVTRGGGPALSLVGSATTSWFPMGAAPMSADGSGFQDYGPSIGRATAVTVDQSDTTGNTVWLGGAYGGVWLTNNATSSPASTVEWKPMLDYGVSLAVGAIGVQPGNGNVVIVGTGEANNSSDSYYGVGIYRTADKGKSWTLITTSADGHNLKGLGFSRITWSRTNSNVLAMGANFTNTVNVANTSIVRGAYYSTDAGASWRLATFKDGTTALTGDRYGANNPFGVTVMSVYWNPADQKFYAAVMDHGFYVSGVNDPSNFTRMAVQPAPAGQTLSVLANCPSAGGVSSCGITRGEITSVPGRNELYVFYVGGNVDRGVWKTTDNGASWIPVNMTDFDVCSDGSVANGCGISQGTYNLWLAAVPNPTVPADTDVYLAAVNQFKCTVHSTDTAANACATTNAEPYKWMDLTHVYGCPPYGITAHVHPDQHAVDYLLTNPNIMYFAHDGGVSRNLNTGSMVTGLCTAHHPYENLGGTMGSMIEFVWATPHPTDDTAAIGGTQDNGSAATNSTIASALGGSQNWTAIHGGDGGYTDIRTSNPNQWFTTYTGVTVQSCTTGFTCTDATFYPYVEQGDVGNDASAFYTPYALDPQDDTKLLIGTCRIWKGTASVVPTTFATTVWAANPGVAISPNLTTLAPIGVGAACTSSDDFVTSIGFGGGVAGGSKVLWATTDGGQILRTGNADAGAAATWTNRNLPASINPGPWSGRFPVSSVAVDKSDAAGNTAYVTIQGFQLGHVARTIDGGGTWTNITGNLPDSPANNVTIDPDDSNVVYVATDVGVFVTSTALAASPTWVEVGPANSSTNAGWLPNSAVTRVVITKANGKKKLIAVTYGRGLWYADLNQAGTATISFNPPGPLSFANTSVGGTSAAQTLTITNSGTAPLYVSDSSETDKSDFNVDSISCGQLPVTFAAGASCQLSITFTPQSIGAKSDTMSIISNATNSPANITFNGTGAAGSAPAVSLDNTTWTFNNVPIGATQTKPIVLTNTGTAALTITGITLTGTNADQFAFVNNTCPISPSTLAAGANCTFTPRFVPTVIQTGLTATLNIADNASGSPHTVSLTGNSVPTTFTFLPTPLAFGNQTVGSQSAAQTATLTNTGAGILTITSISITGTNANQFTSTGNTCGATLASGLTCTYGVKFAPTNAAAASASITLNSNGTGTNTVALTGTGIQAVLGFNPNTIPFGNQRVGSTSATQQVTLSNTGAATLNVTAAALTGQYTRPAGAGGGTCATATPFTVAANSSCTYFFAFAPTATGAQNGSFTITDDAAGSPHAVTFTGTGTQSVASPTPTTVPFGNINLTKTSAPQTVTITNLNGTASLNITTVTVPAPFVKGTDTCGNASVAIGANCTVQVSFAPTALGAASGNLSIASDAPTSPTLVALTGTGTQPVVALGAGTLAFGNVVVNTSAPQQSSTISNTGTGPLTITAIATANTTDWTVTSTCGTLPATVAAGANCSINAVFNPKSLGAHNTTVTITDDAAGSPRTINLTGTGVGASLEVQDNLGAALTTLAFGNQRINTTSALKPAILKNTGTSTLTITQVTKNGANVVDFPGSSDTCGGAPIVLAAGASCQFTFTFAPTATGARTSSVTYTSDSTTGPVTLNLTGTGTVPTISPAPSPLAFGTVRVGTTTAAQTITVTNSGTDTLNITTVAPVNNATNDYALAAGGTCTAAAVAPNGTCLVKVTFTPHAVGAAAAASIAITSDTGAVASTVTNVGLTGTGKAPAITVTTPQNFGTVKVNTGSQKTITITNSGTDTLNVATVLVSGNVADFVKGTDNCTGVAVGFTAPNNTCTVVVNFTPHAAGAAAAGTLTVTHDATGSPTAITLNGTGAVPTATVLPSPLAFGGKPITVTSGPSAITITNTSQVALVVSAIGLTGADYSQTNTCGTLPATLAANGTCVINVSFKPTTTGAKNGTVTVTHDGTGSPVTVNLTGTGEDFAAPSVATTSATVTKGSAGNFGNVTVAATGGSFGTAVTLSCTGLPSGSACNFGTTTLTPGATSASTTLSISTTAASSMRPIVASNHSTRKPLMAFWLVMPGMALLLPAFAGGKRRKWLVRLGLLAFCLLMLISMTACGSGSGGGGGSNPGTPAGTYTVTVVATSGALTHSSPITLTVQ